MLNIRDLFLRKDAIDGRPITSLRGPSIFRRRDESPPSLVRPPLPNPHLAVYPTPEARAAFSLFEDQTDSRLNGYIQMRLERMLRQRDCPQSAIIQMNSRYAYNGEADIEHMWRLVSEELDDWVTFDGNRRKTARPYTFLAASMWRLGDWDKVATAGSNAYLAIKICGIEDEELWRLAQGFYGLGMFYYGIDLTPQLKEAAQLGDLYDALLGGQFSVQILRALSRLEQLRGDHAKSKHYRDRADAMMQTSPAKKLPAPIWQMKVPPGGPYPVDPAEPAKEGIGVRH